MNNTAGTTFFQGGEGGGVTLWGSAATLTRNRIIHNTASITATGWGGGLFLVGGPVILMENTIVSNTASGADFGRGGGIAAMGYGSHRLINNIIAANWVGPIGQGDGYYAAGNLGGIRASFFHNTFADNAKDAIVTGGGCTTLSLSNTLISGHSLGISTTASHYCNKIVADHTLWNSAYTIAEAGNTITTTNDITGNPHFVNPAALDYHISPASEAIDQGMNARVTTDIDGQRRPYGTGFDIGADEFVPEPLLRRWFPMLLKK
ncbi:MAG: hypothetical protein IT330_04855 [Anaerolineae bacterium]|nr:hypothetical protein [Anaerolineae bacterium]